MPAIVGPVQIIGVEGGSIQFGDALVLSPKSASKSVYGSGSGNTGLLVIANNGLNANNTFDVNAVDQPILANN